MVAFLLDLERVFEAIGRTSDRAVDTGSKLTFGGLCLILMVLLAVGFVEAHLTSWPIGGGRHGVGRVAEGNQPAVNPAPAQMARVGTAPAAAASAVAPAPAAATIQPIVVLIPMLESRDLDGLEPAPGGGPMWTVSQPDDGAELKPRLLAASRERVGGGGGITFVPWVAGVAASGLQSRRAVPPAEFTMNSGGIAYRYLRQPLAPDELRPAEPAPDAMAEAEPERAHRAGGLRRAARGPARETDEADAAPAGQPAAGP